MLSFSLVTAGNLLVDVIVALVKMDFLELIFRMEWVAEC